MKVAVFITEPRHRMEIDIPHMLLMFGVFESQRYLNPEAHDLPPRFSSDVNPPPYVFNHGSLMLLLETYHLMRFANMLGELFDPVIRLETLPERRHPRIWTPNFHSLTNVTVFLEWIKSVWTDNDNVSRSASAGAEGEEGEEEDPDRVHHFDRGAILNLMNFWVERRLGIAS
ncbi:hypothetical protein F5051DRAFT_444987 [Lentinula edodes]|nr:hypothetical protein F5051DRAFT_444987 [Lentinula edodes]